jgi:ABC-type uncharacterized transport system involved in gliding motility auxiliary subunit
MSQNERPSPHLGMLGVQRGNLSQEDIITSRLESINVSSAGALAQAEEASTSFEPLIWSSNNAMLMNAALVENMTEPSILFDEFESQNESFVVAARVSGAINSAFPDGRPEVVEAETEEPADDTAAASTSDVANPAQPEQSQDLAVAEEPVEAQVHKASTGAPANIVIIADSDLLSDRLWVQVAQFLGQRIPQPFANNGDFLINSLDNLSGGADLVSIRSRGTYSRPFTRVLEMQRQADDRLRIEEAELLDRLAETEASLAQLNQGEDGNPLGQLTPEIQSEIDRFNNEMVDTRRKLRDVQFQLTEDIDALGSWLKAINVLLVPILLTIIALIAHFSRIRRRRLAY